VYQLRLSAEGFVRFCDAGAKDGARFSLPRFALFGEDGREVWRFTGYPESFSRQLARQIEKGRAARKADRLEDVLPSFVTATGRRAEPRLLAETRWTMIEYWAEWCAPCKRQIADIRDFLQARPELDAKVLLVESDPGKLEPGEWLETGCEEDASGPPPEPRRVPVAAPVQEDPATKARGLIRAGKEEEGFEAFRKLEREGDCPPATCEAVRALEAIAEDVPVAAVESAQRALLQGGRGRSVLVGPGKEVRHDFTGPCDLAQTRGRLSVAGVCQREVEELEGTVERSSADPVTLGERVVRR
jgi:thiol-disulfide isomerase/thioredoxin